jgi:cytochrome c553
MKPATFLLAVTLCLSAAPLRAGDVRSADPDFFEKKIRPLLVERCFSCHGNGKQKGGLSLASRESLLKGSDSGPVVVPGHPEQSRLVDAIRYEKETRMPPKGKLPDDAIADLIAWIEEGAPWPPTPAPSGDAPLRQRGDTITAEDRAFWSFQPVADPPLPNVREAAWPKKPLDRFVLARLDAQGLRPVRTADKRTLLRRATFDLTGLPPAPQEIEAFLADESPDAFARVVDRLLASPHYGERWSRHWLDVARYGEDQAHSFQPRLFPNGYRYRDWVVGAFNDDLPYDRFVIEQIAGDLLADGPVKERLPALGFFALGPHYYGDSSAKKLVEATELDDRLDTLCRGLLGLTVACARCHDHKFDPIPTKDYYSLAGVFQSTKYQEVPFAPADVVEKYDQAQARIKQQDAKIKQFVEAAPALAAEHLAQQTARYMVAAWKLHNQRRGNPPVSVAEVAAKEKLVDVVLDRWVKYLFDKGSEKRAHLAGWREALADLEAKKDPSSEAAALEKVTAAATAFQEEVLGILRERDELLARPPAAAAEVKKARPLTVAGLDKAKADLLQELLAPTGVFGVAAAQAEPLLPPEEQKALSEMRIVLADLKKSAPPMYPTIHTIAEAPAADMKVYLRGDPDREGDVAPRRFLRVLAGDEPQPFTQGSGRLELARAIASKDNPLTARVIVNRVWQHHFGKGLVGTPSNFGRLGQRPTHPELLDHLATGFVAHGWSLKWLHREILLSATYQLSSDDAPPNRQVDPANRLLWRMNRQRLDVEAWRDALLAVSGRLDARLGGPPSDLALSANNRRTLYGSVSRHNLNGLLRLFDFPDPNLSSEQRTTTTVPLQQLFVLNSDFMAEQARALVKELTAASDDAGRIRAAFPRLYGRPATEREVELGLKFLEAAAMPPESGEPRPALSRWEEYAQVLLSANEFTFVD